MCTQIKDIFKLLTSIYITPHIAVCTLQFNLYFTQSCKHNWPSHIQYIDDNHMSEAVWERAQLLLFNFSTGTSHKRFLLKTSFDLIANLVHLCKFITISNNNKWCKDMWGEHLALIRCYDLCVSVGDLVISPSGNQVKLMGRGTMYICKLDSQPIGSALPLLKWISPAGQEIIASKGRLAV